MGTLSARKLLRFSHAGLLINRAPRGQAPNHMIKMNQSKNTIWPTVLQFGGFLLLTASVMKASFYISLFAIPALLGAPGDLLLALHQTAFLKNFSVWLLQTILGGAMLIVSSRLRKSHP